MTPRAYTRKRFVLSDNWRMVIMALIPTMATVYVSQCQVVPIHDLVNSVAAELRKKESDAAAAEGEIRGAEKERARAAENP